MQSSIEFNRCPVIALLTEIGNRMRVLGDALAVINGVIDRRERDRTRKQCAREKAALRKPTTNENQPSALATTKPNEAQVFPSVRKLNQLFDAFWLEYPRKVAKQDALTAFKTKLRENRKDPVAFVNHICESVKHNREANKDWLKDNGQFIPYPATWLRQERWLDESFDPEAEERKRQAEIEARCDAMAEEFFKNFGSDANGKHL